MDGDGVDGDGVDGGGGDGDWVELRVHGVRATPPESMLDIDRVVQVAGDEFGRFFRRADRLGQEKQTNTDGHLTEAYHWGQFTSGSFVQGLWLLLAPFGFVNAAQFTLPRPTTWLSRRAHAVAGAMLRLVGLALTVLFVLTAAVLTVDLWARQSSAATSGFTYVLAMLAPVVLLGGYVLLARPRPPLDTTADELPGGFDAPGPSELARPAFFEGDPDAPALRLLHVAAGLTMVALLGLAPAATRPVGHVLFEVAVAVMVVIAVLVLLLGDPGGSATVAWQVPERGFAAWLHRRATLVAAALLGVAAVAAAVALAVLGTAPPAPVAGLNYPGLDWAALFVMTVAVVGLVVLAAANVVVARCERGADPSGPPAHARFAPYLGGLGCTCLTSMGVFLGVGYAGAFSTAVAATLTTVGNPVRVPELLSRVVYAWGVTAAALVVIVVGALLVRWRRTRPGSAFGERLEQQLRGAGPPAHTLPGRWTRTIAAAMWSARLKNRIPWVLAGFAVLGLVLTGFVIAELSPLVVLAPWRWPELNGRPRDLPGWWGWGSQSAQWPELAVSPVRTFLLALGTVTLTSLSALLVFLGRTALLGDSARRGANVLWDVVAFWPRSAHPFVPATYSQRAVLDIERRIRWHLRPGGRRQIVVCGHSQGSLLSFAALLRIDATPLGRALMPRIGLLTFGSQLQVMFSRGFPAYVNRVAIDHLFTTLDGGWRNLYRDTDPLAGPVLSWAHEPPAAAGWIGAGQHLVRRPYRVQFGPDWRLFDPPLVAAPGSPPSPPPDPALMCHALLRLRGHGDYWLDPAWDAALAAARRDPSDPT